VSHDASKIALVNGVGDIEIWERAAGQRLGLLLAGRPPEGGTPAMDRVTHLAWADNPQRLFAADATGRLAVWDVGGAGPLATRENELSVHALAVSHEGGFVAVLGGDKRVKLFRLQSAGEPAVWSLEPIETPAVAAIENVRAIAFTREPSPHLLIALQSGAIQMLNSTAWEKRHEFSHGAEVTSLTLSPDGSRLAVGGIDGRTTIWNIAPDKLGAEPVLKLEARASFADAIASAGEEVARQEAKGTRYAAAMTEKETFAKNEAEALKGVQAERDKQAEALKAEEAKLTEVATAVTAHEAMIEEAKKAVEQVNAQADADDKAKQDAKASLDKLTAELAPKVTARDEATKKRDAAATLLMQKEQTLANATEAKQRADAAVPIQAKLIATQARIVEQSKQRLAELETRATAAATPVESLVMSAGTVAIAFRGGAVHVRRLSDAALTDEFQVQASSATSALSAMFFADDATLVLMPGSNSSNAAQAYAWSLRPDWRLERAIGGLSVDLLNDRVSGLAFSPDGKSLAIGSGTPSRDGQVKVFAAATGELLRDYGDAHSDSVLALRFSPDGNKIASAAADRTIRILDVATGKVARTLEGHTHHVLGVDWQPDSVGIVSSSADQTVKVWDSETGNVTRTIGGFPKEVTAIVFSAGPRQAITACADGNVRIHKVDDGGGVRTFGVGGDFLHSLATTKDGKVVVAGGQSGKLAFWTGDDGKSIREVSPH
jgi:WD40 repeat protein